MTSWVVADASTFLATVLTEPYSTQADALVSSWIQQGVQIAVPTLFRYEIVAVMRKSVYRNVLTPEEAIQKRDILLMQPVQSIIDAELLKRAYELASRFNRPTAYDSQYLAVAERLGCEFWTVDEKLYNVVNKDLTWVKWLGNLVA